MKIGIFLFDGITALDAVGPYESLARIAQSEIIFVAKQAGPIRTGDRFLSLNADFAIEDLDGVDVLVIPGGHPTGLRAAIADKDLHAWIKAVDQNSRWTCAVCTGALILSATGLLKGRRASTHWRARDVLSRFDVTYSSDRVTIDGKYMTSAGVSAGIDMGLTLCGELAGREFGKAIELSMQYDPQPPFGTGDPTTATPELIHLMENGLRV
jgi:transcriptional regulator GlxA family with amidase domain